MDDEGAGDDVAQALEVAPQQHGEQTEAEDCRQPVGHAQQVAGDGRRRRDGQPRIHHHLQAQRALAGRRGAGQQLEDDRIEPLDGEIEDQQHAAADARDVAQGRPHDDDRDEADHEVDQVGEHARHRARGAEQDGDAFRRLCEKRGVERQGAH